LVLNYNLPNVNITRQPWSEDTEAEQLRDLSVGIMPVINTPFNLGKCGYKLLQYMACGVPAIASPVGVNSTIITDGATGFLAISEDEWYEKIKLIHDNPKRAKDMGIAGRKKIELSYSIEAVLPMIEMSLRNAAAV
jgi:glycosyltransferase involved in cell wall biosynthesis